MRARRRARVRLESLLVPDLGADGALRLGKRSVPREIGVPIIRASGASRKLESWRAGGIVGGLGIKVGNMVPACCEQKSRREHRGPVLSQAPLGFERGGPPPGSGRRMNDLKIWK